MSGSRWIATATVLTAILAAAADAHALDTTRLDLLAGEAVAVMDGAIADAPSRGGLLVLLGIPLATMLSAFLGTLLGIRGLSFTSLRSNDGWREVAYRFRSDRPMRVGKDVIRRMSGVLDDIEELGARIRERSAGTPSNAGHGGVESVEPAAAMPRAPVTFIRREDAPAPAPVAAAVSAPDVPPVAPTESVPAPGRPIARPEGRDADRSTRYRRARALLRDGHDREAVRSMTGLKLAELDLLRCTAEPPGGAP